MDDKRFDQITRALGGVSGRRQAVKSIFGGAAASALGAFGLAEADAKGKNKGKGKGKKGGKKHRRASAQGETCDPSHKVLICHNPPPNGWDKTQCVADSSCQPDHGHCEHGKGHDNDCVCEGYACCGGDMPTCAFCLDNGDCGKTCIESGGDCEADEMCCNGLTCNGSGNDRTCGPKPECTTNGDCGSGKVCCDQTCHVGDCCDSKDCDAPGVCQTGKGTCSNFTCSYDDANDGSFCTPSGAAANRKRKGKGKKAHIAGAPAGVCCGGACFEGDCCSAGDCNKDETCSDHHCVPACQSEGEDCSEQQPCCSGLSCNGGKCAKVCHVGDDCTSNDDCCPGSGLVCFDNDKCNNCREEGHPCTGNQVCCTNLTCAPPSNQGADNRCCPPNSTACGNGENGACCDNDTEICSDNQCVPKPECDEQHPCGEGKVCCEGTCYAGECCENKDCDNPDICQIGPGTCGKDHTCSYDDQKDGTYCGKSAGEAESPVCCDGACVECCSDDNCPKGDVCSSDHTCVPSCQTAGESCDSQNPCCDGLICNPTTATCQLPCGEQNPCGKGETCCGGICIDENICCTGDNPGCTEGEVCCSGTCYSGVCCGNDDCTVSSQSGKRKRKGAHPAGEPSGDVCCDHQCVECCTSGDCPQGDVCTEDHTCVPSCQSQGQTCNAQHPCCEGLTCDPTTSTCQPPARCGTGPACTGDQVCCGEGDSATCVDLGTDQNCARCGDVCTGGTHCVEGTCQETCGGGPACTEGLTCCGEGDAAQCVDTGSDNNNCGTCGNVCPENTACNNGTCDPICAGAGESCADEGCCAPLVCGADNVCRECTPDGGECSLSECCSADYTCKKHGKKKHTCVKAGGGGGGGGGGNGSGCFHVGGKPVPGKPCCPRLHEEHGRCVINRWDHCDQSNKGQRSWCEHGTTCEGGRISPHHQEVCVPKGYRRRQRRRHRQGLGAAATSAPVTTPATPEATPVS